MELKDYQQAVIQDLDTYLDALHQYDGKMDRAFYEYWLERGVQNQNYKNNVTGTPHVCMKVPTAGGKTFIAVNALKTIFDHLQQNKLNEPKFVVWLVPSLSILEQTVKALKTAEHPYRQKLNTLFNGRVEVYERAELLMGASFNADTVKEQLSIVVMSFDALRAKKKEDRKVFQENGYLASFADLQNGAPPLENTDPTALINVIRSLKPVVVVDESHNAETELSVEMLQNLSPIFILDLTATPKNNSNIISYVDAMALKRQNMVKLPVIVANQHNPEEVIMAALNMRQHLEEHAKLAQAQGGDYIRPIVLFQAQPKNKGDNATFEKIKQQLIDLNIAPEEIKIKTANINELKDIDLSSPECPVRYIITINALKEGWDCPFAYILATLANKSSVVDVTQIVGRVLRMPHVRKHSCAFLNMSYVFTASNKFNETLQKVVEGLNKAGFSANDYRDIDVSDPDGSILTPVTPEQMTLDETQKNEYDENKLNANWKDLAIKEFESEVSVGNACVTPDGKVSNTLQNATAYVKGGLISIKKQAIEENQSYEQKAKETPISSIPPELKEDTNMQAVRNEWKEQIKAFKVPQFELKVDIAGGFFEQEWQKLDKSNLLSKFDLSLKDASINFDNIESEIAKVDISELKDKGVKAEFENLEKEKKDQINQIILRQSDQTQVKSIIACLKRYIKKKEFFPIADQQIDVYLQRIVEGMNAEQRAHCLENEIQYIGLIKRKIGALSDEHGLGVFKEWLKVQKIRLEPLFKLKEQIVIKSAAPSLAKSLYEQEDSINSFELGVISKISGLENVLWWHRNQERKGFVLNGFINHYPDFLLMTKKKNLILLEAKGDHLDNSDSQKKMILGQIWENEAKALKNQTCMGYFYFMVFETKNINGAHTVDNAMSLIRAL